MPSPLENTRIGEMFESLTAGLTDNMAQKEFLARKDRAGQMVFAAMGAEYLLLSSKSGHRTPSEALAHWLSFCTLANPALFDTPEKMEDFRKIFQAYLKDVRDIQAGGI